MADFDCAAAQALLERGAAPWVQELDLHVEEVGADSAVVRMRYSDKLCREGGVVCGQALMALADTSMIFAVTAAIGSYRPMTTVDQTSHFLKPLANADCLAEARIIRLGKTMAYGQVTLKNADDGKPVAISQCAWALL